MPPKPRPTFLEETRTIVTAPAAANPEAEPNGSNPANANAAAAAVSPPVLYPLPASAAAPANAAALTPAADRKEPGAPPPADQELLALALSPSPDPERWPPSRQAQALLHLSQGRLANMAALPPEQLQAAGQLSPQQLERLLAILEIGRRQAAARPAPRPKSPIDCTEDAVRLLAPRFAGATQESLQALLLNSRRQPVSIHQIYQGSINRTVIRAAEVFRPAVLENAPFLLLAHNHPSGDPTPSAGDIAATAELYQAGLTLNIGLMDHLVLGEGNSWVSLREQGLGFPPEPRPTPASDSRAGKPGNTAGAAPLIAPALQLPSPNPHPPCSCPEPPC